MRFVCLLGLILIWPYPKDCQLFEVQTVVVCYGNTFSSYISLECGVGEVIQVRNTRAVAKLVSTGCPVELTTLNENTVPDNCCINEPEDCGTLYTGSVYQDYYKRCHGNQNCLSLQASWIDITDTDCNQTLYLPRTNYMIFTFSCIPTNYIKSPCDGIQTTNNSVYIWNSGYPDEMAPGVDSCTCAAEIDCNSTILVRAIDLRLLDDVSGICQQGILVTDGASQTQITCNSNNAFLESTIYSSVTDFITIEIKNTLSENGGNFWIEVYGQDEKAQITLSCGPSVITQAEISDKTTCGRTTTTTTSTTSTTTEDSNKSTTNLVSTVTHSSTSTSTPNTSTPSGITTSRSTAQISSTVTAESTTQSLSSTTNPDFSSSTTSNSATGSITANSTLTSAVSDSTSNNTESSTISATITNTSPTDITSDHQGTTSSQQAESGAVSQVAGGGSSSPLGIIIAVIVVLVILIIILIVLLYKRKQIKQYFCPSEVEDKENVDDTETAEYDTMPNPLLTEGTLPLITGVAAASTNYPTLPGGGFIGRKTTLEPISLPPVPRDVLNLSSTLNYKLPKIENIKSSIRREKSSIADELVEEHTRNPFPNVRNFEDENTTIRETVNETNKESNSGNKDLSESRKERKLRKKRKRMIDRLNRIKTPMQGRKDSVFGFSSSTTRF